MNVFLFLFATVLAVHAESTSVGTSLSIGEDGLNLSVPGLGPNIRINNEGNGVFSSKFSITGNPVGGNGRASASDRIIRVVPNSSPSQLTDSETFFKGVGQPDPESQEPRSRRKSSRQ